MQFGETSQTASILLNSFEFSSRSFDECELENDGMIGNACQGMDVDDVDSMVEPMNGC